jgi:putative ABC transport system ATP-binding protein
MSILEVQHLNKIYRPGSAGEVRALCDVSLAVPAGSFTVLAGPSGSGKSTLLAILGLLERPTSGRVLFQGRDLSRCSDVELARCRRRMGFVFQDFALIPGLPVWENITYPLVPRGVSRPERYRLAGEVLTRFGLIEKATARPRELSGGEQQRVAVARAIIGKPEVVLADEPTSNLDDAAATVVIDLLRQTHAAGTTVVAASHDPRLAALATRVGMLAAGRLAA